MVEGKKIEKIEGKEQEKETLKEFLEKGEARRAYQWGKDREKYEKIIEESDKIEGYKEYISGLIIEEEMEEGEPKPQYRTAGIKDIKIDEKNGVVVTLLDRCEQSWTDQGKLGIDQEGKLRRKFDAKLTVFDTESGKNIETKWIPELSTERIDKIERTKNKIEIKAGEETYSFELK